MEMMTLHAQNNFDVSSAMLAASFQDLEESRLGSVLVGRLAQAKAGLDSVVADFDHEQAVNRRDMREGAYSRWMADTVARIDARITDLTRPLVAELQQRVADLQSRLVAAPPDQRDMVAVMIERRALLRALDPLERIPVYLEACRCRDVATWNAFETCASFDPVRLSAETLAAGRRIRSELDHPDIISAIAETERVLSALESAVRTCKRHCGLNDDIEVTTVADAA